ncbi:HAMP domain-containing histidine kinase [Fulvivirgaceae bacterium PWU4]|uniref:histidine kinase n=1 Tax=Chryseosolibacter histidini TaxID=2782349 RepID=A0AAP2DUD4_9BACT|nr:HAMP domain-containing sensor histidine kinase [Chryseosolibacter histidini]MBT1701142.1 HAMP domain-containing histidine kinase [Chryseosolibacter histidini]
MRSKNSVTVILMASSIVLLLVLQVLWLRSTYRDAAENFRKETTALFRTTIFALQDSLIQRNLLPVQGDSVWKYEHTFPRGLHIKGAVRMKEKPGYDSIINQIRVTERGARVEIFASGAERDSVGRMLRPLVAKLGTDKEPRTFILRLDSDTLKVDSIEVYYKEALANAGIAAPFQVHTFRHGPDDRIDKFFGPKPARFTSDAVRLNPVTRYAVSFTGIEGLLLKEITPQILFSIFLTVLTVASFYIMYKNQRAQQRLMQIKNDFISNVTHELKTPVATVSVALEALKNFHALDNPQRTTEYLEIAQSELNRLTLMTDKILKTAVYEDRGVELKTEKIDLDALVQQVLSSMKLVFEKRKTQLTYQKEGTDFTFDGSLAHLTNVLYNLIDNALKYTGDGALINISLANRSKKLVLSVRDNGIGISPEYHKKIFEKFFRVPAGDVHNIKGYGLGLNYVAHVVRSHHGEITVDSAPGKGSCFVITLPLPAEQNAG